MSLEDKLDQLRQDWAKATGVNRKIIEQRAKLIKWAIEKRGGQPQNPVLDVKQAFGIK